jgi:precorrin-6A/cobalt-precorrin-6A reductase
MRMRILVLGGTAEASALARALATRADLDAILSFAGRTKIPDGWPIRTRVGGFGGVEGLAAYLRSERIDAVVDATHPFATRISHNAQAACASTGTPIIVLTRPAWRREANDRWISVPALTEAPTALGEVRKRVFLTIGRLELAAFETAPQHHYLVRSIEPLDPRPRLPHLHFIAARGPFDVAAERALMQSENIEILVTKNSGAPATFAKIEAARQLDLPVVMIDRPAQADAPAVRDPSEVLAWIDRLQPAPVPAR